MSLGINISGGTSPAMAQSAFMRTDINLPDANNTGIGGTKGPGASVEVSLSGQAMLAIDMDSLARKGYSEVDIDTDGKPGAEISIQVKPGAGTVMVAADGGIGGAGGMSDQLSSMLDGLSDDIKQLFAQLLAGGANGTDETKKKDALQLFMELLETISKEMDQAQSQGMDPSQAVSAMEESIRKSFALNGDASAAGVPQSAADSSKAPSAPVTTGAANNAKAVSA